MKRFTWCILNSTIFLAATLFSSCQPAYYISQKVNPYKSNHFNYNIFSRIENGHEQNYLGLQLYRNEIPFLYNDSGFTARLDFRVAFKKDELNSLWDTVFSITKNFSTFDSTRYPAEEKFFIRIPEVADAPFLYFLVSETQLNKDISFYYDIIHPETEKPSEISTIRFYEDQSLQNISLTKRLCKNQLHNPSLSFDILDRQVDLPMQVQLVLTRIKSDTSSARLLYALPLVAGSVETRGYKTFETEWSRAVIDTTIKDHKNQATTFSYIIPDSLKEGTYLTQVQLISGEKILTSHEDRFYIFPDNFPELKNLSEASQMLKYIAYPNEYDIIKDSGSSLKENFDNFWIRLSGGDTDAAKKKIAKFYKRVNEANMYFSNYKPGWKTDMGMTYILLGPPKEISWQGLNLQLQYPTKTGSDYKILYFKPIRNNDNIIGYYLDRGPNYEGLWIEYRRLWERN